MAGNGSISFGSSLVHVNNNLSIGVSATGTLSTHTGHLVTMQDGIVINVMPPSGGVALNTAWIGNVTDQINALSNEINSVNPCAAIQALVNDVMAALQAQIISMEAQIAALVPIITIPSANLGAIVGWITSFAAPSITASANLAIQIEQIVAAVASLTAAIEAAASRLTHCSITIPPLVVLP